MLSLRSMSTQVQWANNRDNRELAWITADLWQGAFLTHCKGA